MEYENTELNLDLNMDFLGMSYVTIKISAGG